jgi:hypothetical protein
MRLFGLLYFIAVINACTTEQEVPLTTSVHIATLKVNCYLLQNGADGNPESIPLSGVSVALFENEVDRESGVNAIVIHQTDSEGFTQFSNLQLEQYFLRASHPTYGLQDDETLTPDGSVSFMEFFFQ